MGLKGLEGYWRGLRWWNEWSNKGEKNTDVKQESMRVTENHDNSALLADQLE